VQLRGVTQPGGIVTVSLALRNAQGRDCDYRDVVRARSDGTFVFHLPYATDGRSGDFVPLGNYMLELGGERRQIRIAEADVMAGRTVSLGN
jgi:hypothetical protein